MSAHYKPYYKDRLQRGRKVFLKGIKGGREKRKER